MQGYGVPSVTPIVYEICKSSTLDDEVVSLDAVVSLGLHGVVNPNEKRKNTIKVKPEKTFLNRNSLKTFDLK